MDATKYDHPEHPGMKLPIHAYCYTFNMGLEDLEFEKPAVSSGLKWNLLATWAIILCTVLNFAIFLRTSHFSQPKPTDTPLRRPNQFIGLESLEYNRSLLREEQLTITTFPTFIHQIDQAQPSAILPSSAQLKFTSFGSIAPETRLFLATENASIPLRIRSVIFDKFYRFPQ
jgi:hypothetical protein